MTIRGGPDIIEDGLVLHLDAAEPLCFRGEPTTNVVTSPFSATSGFGRSGGSVTENAAINFNGNQTASLVNGFNWLAKLSGYSSIVAGETYTTTWILKKYNQSTARLNWGGSHSGSKPINDLNFDNGTATNGNIEYLGNGWFRCWYTSTLNSGTASYYPQLTPTAAGAGYYFGGLQVERKSYATPFVSGTRGSTVATGGGLLDLTNNGNDGTITRAASPSAIFYNASNGGSFVFNGSNDYATFSLNNPSGDWVHSIVFWMYLNNDQSSIGSRVDPFQIGSVAGYSQYSAVDIANNNFNWYFYSNDTRITNTNIFSGQQWYHIGLTYSGGGATTTNKKFYLNGVYNPWNFSNGSGNLVIAGNTTLTIGRDAPRNTAYFPGRISSFCIYDRPLSANEVQQNYNATKGRFGL